MKSRIKQLQRANRQHRQRLSYICKKVGEGEHYELKKNRINFSTN